MFLRARSTLDGIIAGCIAPQAFAEAAPLVQDARSWTAFADHANSALERTRMFLSSKATAASPRLDYPDSVVTAIAVIAGLTDVPYSRAIQQFRIQHPELLSLANDAAALQFRAWTLIRLAIDRIIPEAEVQEFRQMPFDSGVRFLLRLVRHLTGVRVPARIIQNNYWGGRRRACLTPNEISAGLPLANGMVNRIDNATFAIHQLIAEFGIRIEAGVQARRALNQVVRNGVRAIGAATRGVAYEERFVCPVGAWPDYGLSFAKFVQRIQREARMASVDSAGAIEWGESKRERGFCPVQYSIESARFGVPRDGTVALRVREVVESWRAYSESQFNVQPCFSSPTTPAELFAALVLFACIKDGGPLHPGTESWRNLRQYFLDWE